ncbi:MAG: hypothetical protein Q9175_003453 [Cornicularia normoerica]
MSPPPRHEVDDYMNVHVLDHHHHKRKHPSQSARKPYNSREGSGSSRPWQRSVRSGPQTTGSHGSDCELCAAGVSDDDENSGSNDPLIKSFGRPNDPLHKTQNTTKVNGVHVETWPTLSSSIVAVDEADSPAVNTLRSHSLRIPIRSNSQGLQRVSTALVNTLNLFRPNPAVSFTTISSHKASKQAEEVPGRSSAYSKGFAYRDINPRRSTSKDGKDNAQTLGTPATITLRKASNVYATSHITTSMSASLTREREHKRAADAPACELLAFYSSPTLEERPTLTDLPSPESAEASRSLKEQPTFTLEMQSQSVRRGSKSVSQVRDISNARRCSIPAEAALTFADVHVAPGSFAVGERSRKQSLVPTEFSHRISTVQFRSRNSVHEVIWREGETASDSSLTLSSRASQDVGHSFRSTPSPECEGSPTQELVTELKGTKATLPMLSNSTSMFTKMPDNLFQWTWGASSAAAEGTPRTIDPKSDTLGQETEAIARAADTKADPLGQVLVNSTFDPGVATSNPFPPSAHAVPLLNGGKRLISI